MELLLGRSPVAANTASKDAIPEQASRDQLSRILESPLSIREDALLTALSRLGGHNSGHSAETLNPAGSGYLAVSTANREG